MEKNLHTVVPFADSRQVDHDVQLVLPNGEPTTATFANDNHRLNFEEIASLVETSVSETPEPV